MDRIELERRTMRFAVDVLRLVGEMSGNTAGNVLGRQLLRSATSVGANYREANRAESAKDFAHKLGIVEKETAESGYWLELAEQGEVVPAKRLSALRQEADELLRIFTSATRTIRRGK